MAVRASPQPGSPGMPGARMLDGTIPTQPPCSKAGSTPRATVATSWNLPSRKSVGHELARTTPWTLPANAEHPDATCRTLCTDRVQRSCSEIGFKKWHCDVSKGFENDSHGHAYAHLVDWAIDDVGDLAEAGLFGQVDDGNHVGFSGCGGAPLMMIDCVRSNGALSTHWLGNEFTGETLATDRGRWVIPHATGRAAQNAKLTRKATRPVFAV